jgi:hypothetical protein
MAERTLCNSLVLALACGLLVAGVLLTCGRAFLAGMGTAPQLLHPAWQYLSIRQAAFMSKQTLRKQLSVAASSAWQQGRHTGCSHRPASPSLNLASTGLPRACLPCLQGGGGACCSCDGCGPRHLPGAAGCLDSLQSACSCGAPQCRRATEHSLRRACRSSLLCPACGWLIAAPARDVPAFACEGVLDRGGCLLRRLVLRHL